MQHPLQATIMPILRLSDKIVMSFSHEDQTLWPVYIIIGNLDAKTQQSQKRQRILFLGFIPIIHERSKNANNKDKNLKVKIYYLALKTIL